MLSGGAVIATYDVNALGQRVRKTVGGTVTHFVYDEQGRLLGEYDGAGTIIQETVWLDDLPVAILRPVVGQTPLVINTFYVHADHLGSPRAVTNRGKNGLRWTWDNVDPFGGNAANPSPTGDLRIQLPAALPRPVLRCGNGAALQQLSGLRSDHWKICAERSDWA